MITIGWNVASNYLLGNKSLQNATTWRKWHYSPASDQSDAAQKIQTQSLSRDCKRETLQILILNQLRGLCHSVHRVEQLLFPGAGSARVCSFIHCALQRTLLATLLGVSLLFVCCPTVTGLHRLSYCLFPCTWVLKIPVEWKPPPDARCWEFKVYAWGRVCLDLQMSVNPHFLTQL